jgi:succinyl-CoA synthetase alpha subunit
MGGRGMKKIVVQKENYADSVFLMLLSRNLKKSKEIRDVSVVMGTPSNIDLLVEMGYSETEFKDVFPNDLVIAVDCENPMVLETVINETKAYLWGNHTGKEEKSYAENPVTLQAACTQQKDSNLAIISVPGQYAAYEACIALKKGLHVLLFSNNVSVEDEIDLKRQGREKGLLVMGPDCGTAIIGGKGLCFSNAVSSGPIGIVAASGTGIQEVSCLLDRFGTGVSQAIGTGGRDLQNLDIGGSSMLMGIAALAADDETKVIVILSKPPKKALADTILSALERTGKPAVVHFLGVDVDTFSHGPTIRWASNLEEVAILASNMVCPTTKEIKREGDWPFDLDSEAIDKLVKHEIAHMMPQQKYLRGYYTGGTLASEAVMTCSDLQGGVWSNKQMDRAYELKNPYHSIGNSIIDLGDDIFTVGKPHPMIDPAARTDRIDSEMSDSSIAVMVCDCLLGQGVHEDPAGILVESLVKAKKAARERGQYLSAIVSVTGTNKDPQNRKKQIEKFLHEQILVMPSNYQAVRLAKRILLREFGPKTLHVQTYTHRLSSRSFDSATIPPIQNVSPILSLFKEGPKVINLGLETFCKDLKTSGVPCLQISWNPPGRGNILTCEALSRIEKLKDIDIEKANAEAMTRVLHSIPLITGIGRAGDIIPGMRENLLLHAGPPITWEAMCGPMRGAVIGALMYENLAKDAMEAEELVLSGQISFEPCHSHSCVGPMAGIISQSMPVWIIENKTYGNKAFATLNEGLGKVLRYGSYDRSVLERLKWMETTLAPVLQKAIDIHGPLDVRNLVANALAMGDECHNRNKGATSLFIREMASSLVRLEEDKETLAKVFEFLNSNDHFFLNISMAAAKSTMDAATDIEGSTLVTAMARNGTEFGIQLSSLGDRWFVGPASVVEGLYLPGFSASDAALDIGDSTITETSGLGAFALAASPAILNFIGGSVAESLVITKNMFQITLCENPAYRIPYIDFKGTPTGIDVLKVVETGIVPMVNTGIAHKDAGMGMVGAGMVKPPMCCFLKAVMAFAEKYCSF